MVLSRQKAIVMLNYVIVAPVTSTIRGSPGEVVVGIEQGLKCTSAINLDGVQTVEKSKLTHFIGSLDTGLMDEVCRALAAATGCNMEL